MLKFLGNRCIKLGRLIWVWPCANTQVRFSHDVAHNELSYLKYWINSWRASLMSAIFFKINFFKIFFQEYHQCRTIWIKIRPDDLSGLIWAQPDCKSYQQMIPAGKRVKTNLFILEDNKMAQNGFSYDLVSLFLCPLNLFSCQAASIIV